MKKITAALFFILILAGCSDKPEIPKAKETVEALMHAIDQEDYQGASEYYTADFNASEPAEVRTEKFRQIRDAFGKLESFALKESKEEARFGEPAEVILTYTVRHSALNSVETFVVVKEEGKHKVSRHDIKGENQ